MYPIHPAFRIIATGDLPSASHPYITQEVMSLFHFHHLPSLNDPVELERLLTQLAIPEQQRHHYHHHHRHGSGDRISGRPEAEVKERLAELVRFSELLKKTNHLHLSLSIRQLIRASRRIAASHDTEPTRKELKKIIHNLLLYQFLPSETKKGVDKLIYRALGGDKGRPSSSEEAHRGGKANKAHSVSAASLGTLQVDGVTSHNHPAHLVPDIDFFSIPSHVSLLHEMHKDFSLGEHLLLIGPQGVGKNKLTDKFLQTLKYWLAWSPRLFTHVVITYYHGSYPRQYIQLHRDTTVSSLTLQPSLDR